MRSVQTFGKAADSRSLVDLFEFAQPSSKQAKAVTQKPGTGAARHRPETTTSTLTSLPVTFLRFHPGVSRGYYFRFLGSTTAHLL